VLLKQDTASNLASGVAPKQWACVAGTGLAISQDAQLRFVVEAVAPGGGAEEEGSIKVGDFLTNVDGVPCVNTHGLSEEQIDSIRQMSQPVGNQTAAGEPGAGHTSPLTLFARSSSFGCSSSRLCVGGRKGMHANDDRVESECAGRSICTLDALRDRLRGFPMSHVWLRIARGGGWREYDVEVQRKVLPSLAASYM
jgi:hypothetical protein